MPNQYLKSGTYNDCLTAGNDCGADNIQINNNMCNGISIFCGIRNSI